MDCFSFGSRVLWCVSCFLEISEAVRFCASCVHAVKYRRAKKGWLVFSINANDWITSEYFRTYPPCRRAALKSARWSELKQRRCCPRVSRCRWLEIHSLFPLCIFIFLKLLAQLCNESKLFTCIIYYCVFTNTFLTKRTKICLNQSCN